MISPKRIAAVLSISLEDAKRVRKVLELHLIKGEPHPEYEVDSPSYETYHDSPSRKLYIINRMLEGFHGVEIIPSEQDDMYSFRGISYLNAGDSYAATLMYDHGRGRWLLGCWGDIMENHRYHSRFDTL